MRPPGCQGAREAPGAWGGAPDRGALTPVARPGQGQALLIQRERSTVSARMRARKRRSSLPEGPHVGNRNHQNTRMPPQPHPVGFSAQLLQLLLEEHAHIVEL